MDGVTVVHCADLHLGAQLSVLGKAAELRQAEYLITFERVINLCRERKADVLLIAGDLFDSNDVKRELARRVFELIASVPETHVVIAAGNHDPITADSPYLTEKLPENAIVFGENVSAVSIPEKNVKIYGFSFASPAFSRRIKLPSADGDTVNIFLMHADLNADFSSRYNPVTTADIEASRMDYVALGHIHKGTGICRAGNTYYAYSGCLEPSGFDEEGEKGVLCGTVGKHCNSMEFVPLSVRKYREVGIDITSADSSTAISELIKTELFSRFGEGFERDFYKIILTGKTSGGFSPDLSIISGTLSDELYFVKLKNATTVDINTDALTHEFTLKGLFAKKMAEKIANAEDGEKEMYEQALRLGLCAFDGEVKPDEI